MKKYSKTHTNQVAAKLHVKRIKSRGAKVETEKQGEKTIVRYSFPSEKKK